MKIPMMIKHTRELLKETQTEFASRFNSTSVAVSYWERGMRTAPYRVIEFVMEYESGFKTCFVCEGKGYIEADPITHIPKS